MLARLQGLGLRPPLGEQEKHRRVRGAQRCRRADALFPHGMVWLAPQEATQARLSADAVLKTTLEYRE